MIKLPDYWLQTQTISTNQFDHTTFDQIYFNALEQKYCTEIQYDLAAPKWQFLNYLVEKHNIVTHGSGNPNITLFEPRQASDLNEFGSQKAVYAAADGVWPMFFAIIDRDNHAMSLNNGCVQLFDGGKPVSESLYMFSISQGFLQKKPWRKGTVYLLPSETFVEQQGMPFGEYTVRIKQQASLVPVKPIAQIDIYPEEFPFLAQIREHDDSRIQEYAQAIQTGGAWPD